MVSWMRFKQVMQPNPVRLSPDTNELAPKVVGLKNKKWTRRGGVIQMWTYPKKKRWLLYTSLWTSEYGKKVYSGEAGIWGYRYLDNTHTQGPVVKIEGIDIWLKYEYPGFDVNPIPPTGGRIFPNRLYIILYFRWLSSSQEGGQEVVSWCFNGI